MKRFLPALQVLLASALFLLALRALQKTLASYRWRDSLHYVSSLPKEQVVAAMVLTILGYLVMTGYDAFALRHIDRALPYWSIALAAFTGYAINNNLGLSGVVGTSLRYRFYSRWGLRASEFAAVFIFCTVTYWLGFLLGGSIFLLSPPPIPPAMQLPLATIRLLGVMLLPPALGYLLWVVIRREPLRVGQWCIALPKPSIFVAQVVISMADWMIAGAVLYTLLPGWVPLSFIDILGVFLLAQTGGLVSNVPGGVGVFEAIALMFLTPYLPPTRILGVLVAFRGIYFLFPLFVALLLLASHVFTAGRQRSRRVNSHASHQPSAPMHVKSS